MLGKVISIYPTKDVYLGTAQTFNTKAGNTEPQVQTVIIPMMNKGKDEELPEYVSLYQVPYYYNLVEVSPIAKEMKTKDIKSVITIRQINEVATKMARENGMTVIDSKGNIVCVQQEVGKTYSKKAA